VGDGGPRFYLTLTPVAPDPASAFFLVNTKDYEGAVRAADRAWKYLYASHPEARFKIKRLAMGAGRAVCAAAPESRSARLSSPWP
jgi:hypothetical protein